MSGKVLIAACVAALLLAAGCTRVQEQAPPQKTAAVAPPPNAAPKPVPERPPAKPAQVTAAPAASREPAAPPPPRRASLPALIKADTAWIDYGKVLVVTRGNHQPVPLFRQAIVLASVRAAVAGSPPHRARSSAATLTSPSDAARMPKSPLPSTAIAVPEVSRLEILLQG